MQGSKELVLGLDTSGSTLLVVAQRDGKRVVRHRKGIKQERLLFPAVESALAALNATLGDVKKICIIRGPGRFTGIRISLTFASMMAYLNQTKIYGITLFELLRRQVEASAKFIRWKQQHPQGKLGIVLHAFREEYFLQIFDHPAAAPAWLSREELLKRLAGYAHPLFLAGTDKDGADLSRVTGDQYVLAAPKDCRVIAQTLPDLTQDESLCAHALEPLYLKPARFELVNSQ